MKSALAAALVALALPAAAHAAIVIEHAQIRPTFGGQGTTAAYMTIRNTGAKPDRLVGASCACAGSVMAHRSVTENGITRMVMDMAVVVPAHGAVVFDAKGRHLMLEGVKTPIVRGSRTRIVLKFETAGRVPAVFTADDLAGMVDAGRSNPH
jgi:copper(I)-binding protein